MRGRVVDLVFFLKNGGGGWVVGWKGISRRVVTYGRISVVCVFKKTTSLWRIYWMIWCYVPQQIRVEHGWGLLSFLHLFFWWWFLLAFKPYKRNKSVVWVICGGYTTCVYNDYPPNISDPQNVWHFWRWFPFPKVVYGLVSLEGTYWKFNPIIRFRYCKKWCFGKGKFH